MWILLISYCLLTSQYNPVCLRMSHLDMCNGGFYRIEKEEPVSIIELYEKKQLLDVLKNEKIMNSTKLQLIDKKLELKGIKSINYSNGGLFNDFLDYMK